MIKMSTKIFSDLPELFQILATLFVFYGYDQDLWSSISIIVNSVSIIFYLSYTGTQFDNSWKAILPLSSTNEVRALFAKFSKTQKTSKCRIT